MWTAAITASEVVNEVRNFPAAEERHNHDENQ
jgi:hypothetical protein